MIQRTENKTEEPTRREGGGEQGVERVLPRRPANEAGPGDVAVARTDAAPGTDTIVGQAEALLFVATEALTPRRMAEVLGEDVERVRLALAELKERHDGPGSGIHLTEIAGGWRLLTRPEHADAVAALAGRKAQDRLSPAALETLAIVAYKQPVSRAEIERIRGVGVGPILRHLLEIDLIKVAGREEGLGRALLYGSTRSFLDRFGLKSIRDLPASLEL